MELWLCIGINVMTCHLDMTFVSKIVVFPLFKRKIKDAYLVEIILLKLFISTYKFLHLNEKKMSILT